MALGERKPCLKLGCRVGFALFILAPLVGCVTPKKKNAALTTEVTRGVTVKFPSGLSERLVRHQEPNYPTYDEAVRMMENPSQHGELKAKVERLRRTPAINNTAFLSGKRPVQASTPTLGPFLRVATWNIEKSLAIEQVAEALESPVAYEQMLSKHTSRKQKEMLRQRERLATADIIFLQEMDVGVSRSGYLDAARTLAKKLDMNYAYAVQAVEVDPVLLGLEPVSVEKNGTKHFLPIDKARYKGGFGSAVLSRYPITKAEVIPLKTIYDWYDGEKKKADFVEEGRRAGTAIAFENEIRRELKFGGRCYFRVDVAVPQAPTGVVTLVNNHLEIKTTPKGREAQMVEILEHVKDIPHPVIMAGDHNSAPEDVSATSLARVVWRQVNTPAALANTTANVTGLVTGTFVPLYRERGIINVLKNFQNPLAPDVPIIFPNPVRGMFERVRDHRFADGTAFDFRGNKKRSINGQGRTLSNSNEHRLLVGQRTTFSVRRPIGPIGRYRLDWFFVRSGSLMSPSSNEGSYQFAPHFGETLAEFNDGVKPHFSDHRPIVIDLPLGEPPLQ